MSKHLQLNTLDDREEFLELIQFMDGIFVATLDARKPPGK